MSDLIYTYGNTATNSMTTWFPNRSTGHGYDYNSTTTSTIYNPIQVEYIIKRCRECHHAHIEGQSGCIDAIGSSVTFCSCQCKEYVPSDNLEYLEYLYKKKIDK